MARRNRFAPPGYWLHLTQRGNYRQTVFSSDADREHFLSLLETHSEERGVRIAAYTLMSNHFHLVAAADRPDAISLFMMNVNSNTPPTATPPKSFAVISGSVVSSPASSTTTIGDSGSYTLH